VETENAHVEDSMKTVANCYTIQRVKTENVHVENSMKKVAN